MQTYTRTWLVVGAAAIALVGVASMNSRDWLLYNHTSSVPRGFYVRTDADVALGALVTIRARSVSSSIAASRNFTDDGDRFIKRVAAGAGTEVCGHRETISIGPETFSRETHDSVGRELPTWDGCHVLEADELFLMGDTDDSFDSRYFGIVRQDEIEGVWRPF